MRILVTNTGPHVVGGVETYLRVIIPALQARGHTLALLTSERVRSNEATITLPDVPLWSASGSRVGDIATRVAEWCPDLVFAHGLEDPALEATLVKRFPTIFFAHNYYGTCISGTRCRSWPAASPCERRLGPGCLIAYLPRRCGGLNPLTMLSLYRLQRRRQNLLGLYLAVLVASRHMRDEYSRHGVAEDRLHLAPLFPPGVEPDPEAPSRRPPSSRILLLGRLTDVKGGRFLVEAVRQAREWLNRPLTLVVAGDGPERTALEGQAQQTGVPAEFHGWVDAERRTGLMRGADLLAVPSVWPEPFGLVGLEAGCVGLPAVGFAVGGIPDWLSSGVSGELAPGDRPDASHLADALVRALRDEGHWNRLRVGAWEMARRFTREAHLDRLHAILEAAVRLSSGKEGFVV